MEVEEVIDLEAPAGEREEPFRSLFAVELSLEEEFYLGVGVAMNNWYALQEVISNLEAKMNQKIGARESKESQARVKELIEGVFWTAFNSILAFKNLMCSWDDSVEYVATILAQDLDVVVEDGSTGNLMSDLLEMYHIMQKCNHRSEMASKFSTYSNNLHVITKEPINYSLMGIIRKFPHWPPVRVYAIACPVSTIDHVYLQKRCPEFVHHKHRLLKIRDNNEFTIYKTPASSDSESDEEHPMVPLNPPNAAEANQENAVPNQDQNVDAAQANQEEAVNPAEANLGNDDWVMVSRRRARN